MKGNIKIVIAAAIGGIASLACLPAQALPFLNGTIAIGDTSGTITHIPPGNLITASTSVTFADPDADADADVNVNSATGTFAPLLSTGDEVNIQTAVMDLTALATKQFLFNELSNTNINGVKFTATSFTELISQNTTPNFAITLFGNGVWTDANLVWATTAGAYTLSLTQTTGIPNPAAAISFSGTLSAFNNPVPEPGMLGLMGLGFVGLGFLRRSLGSQAE